MHLLFILLLILPLTLNAKEIHPLTTIKTSGLVSDFVEDKGFLYVATDAGIVDIIDLSSQKIVRQIKFDPLPTAKGDMVPARVHSIDRYDGKTLMVTSGTNAYRNVWIDDGQKCTKIIDASEHRMPKSAYFSGKNTLLFGSFGSDITLYDHSERTARYERHISESTMGGMVLSPDKSKAIVSDESGEVRVVDVNSSKVLQTFSSEHVDNIYRVAYANHTLVTAGQDRRVGVYRENGSAYHIKSDFLVYAVGISPSGKTAVYSSGFEHDLQLFNTANGKKGDRLVGHYAIPGKILFIDETSIISAGDEERIFFWKLEK